MSRSEKWDKRFLRLAYEIATWSKDDSTKVGAVIIGDDKKPKSFGYNGFPRNIDDTVTERYERPTKYLFSEHAERNAIYNADVPLDGCTMYVTHFPCSDCMRAIIQKGITTVVIDAKNGMSSDWKRTRGDSFEASVTMMVEANIKLVEVRLD